MHESIRFLQMDKKRHPERYLSDEQSDAMFKLLKNDAFLAAIAREPDPEITERMCFEKLDELVAESKKPKSKLKGWFE